MDIVWTLISTWWVLLILFFIRNEVAFRIRMKALKRAAELSDVAIARREPWETYHDMYKARTYNSVMFDLRIWTAEKAYPELFQQP